MQQPDILKTCPVPSVHLNAPSGFSSSSQFPLPALPSAQALFRPLSPDFTPPPPALAPPVFGSPHARRAQGVLPTSQRPISSSAPPRPLPGFDSPRPSPTPGPGPSQPRSPPRPRPALRPLGGYQPVPPARRRRRAANRRLPHCGPSRAGG
ncbi:hypothetical protein HPG69_001939 [Diceros bicornis minor]|uniref:Uncharacterized protein n=1 Tax=Diceros bicornis minor TaxID=77932 RepID=A0A7J7FBN6_DICBM|nr:hypothetical protein HPG69_001939 [Diceros bicornis minor]